MDENHQDKTGNKQIATEDKLWIPPLSPKVSPKDQKKLERLRIKQLGGRRYKVTEEYSNSGQLSKISREFPSKQTRWDWAHLLIVPLLIAVLGFIFTGTQYLVSLQIAQDNRTQDLQIAKDTQDEATLKAYLDDMSNLLLNNKLLGAKPGEAVRQVARERTLTTLRRLKANRNRIVVQFLQDTHLIGGKNAVIDFFNADLSNDDLRGVNLRGADLREADLCGAGLSGARLSGAGLSGARLSGADLSGAHLDEANLTMTDLERADLGGAFLNKAELFRARLDGADLRGALLFDAHLRAAFLIAADLSGAHLFGADLSFANLSTAKVTQEQLNEATSLQGTIMPNGSEHP